MLTCVACGDRSGGQAHCDTMPQEGQHYEFIRSLEGKSLAEKTGLVLERIRQVPLPESGAEATTQSLADELISHCELSVLLAVERILRPQDEPQAAASLRMIYLALSDACSDPKVAKAVEKLACELPENLILAVHRPYIPQSSKVVLSIF